MYRNNEEKNLDNRRRNFFTLLKIYLDADVNVCIVHEDIYVNNLYE